MHHNGGGITVRLATAKDAARVAYVSETAFALLRNVYRPTGEAEKRQAARAQVGTRLVAEIDGMIVGTVRFAAHKKHVHIIGLAVHPDYQQRGVARRMIDAVVKRTPSLGHDTLVIDTIKETGNVRIFERIGFRVVREMTADWCESDVYSELHDVMMERRLHADK